MLNGCCHNLAIISERTSGKKKEDTLECLVWQQCASVRDISSIKTLDWNSLIIPMTSINIMIRI